MKGTNQAYMYGKIFQVVGTASAKSLKQYHAHWFTTSREAGAAEMEASRRRVVGNESKEPEESRSGKIWWTRAITPDLFQMRRDTKTG